MPPTNIRAGILGAGLGSRLQSRSKAKPLAPLRGESLLSRLVSRLRANQVENIQCALRDELLEEKEKRALPQAAGLSYLFVNTDSSLHTLVALISRLRSPAAKGPVLFVMADTIMKDQDFSAFLRFCKELPAAECAVLVTPYVDDEKPLWVQTTADGTVHKFSDKEGQYVTSGAYFLNEEAMEIAEEVLRNGLHKMRNFLAALAERQIPIKTFVVSKTIDVDHPSDLDKAADFLQSD